MRQEVLSNQLDWMIRLRWLAIVGVLIAIFGSHYIMGISLPLFFLLTGVGFLLIHNILSFFISNYLKKKKDTIEKWLEKAYIFANFQIIADLFLLTYLIHFSGGLENPFIFYYIFHMVISSIILPKRVAYFPAGMAVIFLMIMGICECINVIPHYPLEGFIGKGTELHSHLTYVGGVIFVFMSTIFLTVYFATAIVERLRERERELVALNKELEEHDRLKSRYVLTVSHDIQGSLVAIQSCLKVVLSNLTGDITEKTRDMVERAEKRTTRLICFVKYLLSLSRIKAMEEVKKEKISFIDIIKRIMEKVTSSAVEKNIKLLPVLPESGMIYANEDMIEQLFSNLIINSIRYTLPGGSVGVEIRDESPSSAGSSSYRCLVWDTGIGISDEDLPHIFEDFYRAGNACETSKDGTGLGLSIVKEIVKVHAGEIWVESQVGKGSKFHLILPKNI